MTNDQRTPDEIERDIEDRRSQLSDSVNDLQKKFSVNSMLEDVKDMVFTNGSELSRSVGRTLGDHPGAVMLIGAGLAWLMIGKSRETKAADRRAPYSDRYTSDTAEAGWLESAKERVKAAGEGLASAMSSGLETAEDLKARLLRGTEGLSEEAKARVLAARQAAVEARSVAKTALSQGKAAAASIFSEQPVVLGALGMALGAAVGAAIPRSRFEDQNLGAVSDRLVMEAQRIFKEERARANELIASAKSEVLKSVEEAKADAASLLPEGKTIGDVVVDRIADTATRVAATVKTERQGESRDNGDS